MAQRPWMDMLVNGQRWYLLAPATHQLQEFEYLRVGVSQSPVQVPTARKVQPLHTFTKLVNYGTHENPLGDTDKVLASISHRKISQKSAFLDLPLEIMWTILGMLDRCDIINLSVTSQVMFKIGCPFINDDIRAELGLWSGQPLAIMSDFATSLPEAFFTNGIGYEYMGQLDLAQSTPSNGIAYAPGHPHQWHASRYIWTMQDVFPLRRSTQTSYFSLINEDNDEVGHQVPANHDTTHTDINEKRGNIRKQRTERNEDLVYVLLSSLLPHKIQPTVCICDRHTTTNTHLYYLRNHTTHELICLCTSNTDNAVDPRHLSQPSKPPPLTPFTLDDILVTQSRHYGPVNRFTDFNRRHIYTRRSNISPSEYSWIDGPWAAHTFDVVSRSYHKTQFPNASKSQHKTASSTSNSSVARWRDVTHKIYLKMAWENELFKHIEEIDTKHDTRAAEYKRRKIMPDWFEYMLGQYPGDMAYTHTDDSGSGVAQAGSSEEGRNMARRNIVKIVGKWRKEHERIVEQCVLARAKTVAKRLRRRLRRRRRQFEVYLSLGSFNCSKLPERADCAVRSTRQDT